MGDVVVVVNLMELVDATLYEVVVVVKVVVVGVVEEVVVTWQELKVELVSF